MLHQLIEETDYNAFLNPDDNDKIPFYRFKERVNSLYQATKGFASNLLRDLEVGL